MFTLSWDFERLLVQLVAERKFVVSRLPAFASSRCHPPRSYRTKQTAVERCFIFEGRWLIFIDVNCYIVINSQYLHLVDVDCPRRWLDKLCLELCVFLQLTFLGSLRWFAINGRVIALEFVFHWAGFGEVQKCRHSLLSILQIAR